jgi:hypothetical protein
VQQFPWTALITLLALLLYMGMIIGVGRARAKYKIAAPAMTGDAAFERHFRVHMNTLESLPAIFRRFGYSPRTGATNSRQPLAASGS